MPDERLHRIRMLHLSENAVDAEGVVAGGPVRPTRGLLHFQRNEGFPVRPREVTGAFAQAANPDPAPATPQFGQNGSPQPLPLHFGVSEEHDGGAAGNQERSHADVARLAAYRVKEGVLGPDPSASLHDNHPVRPLEVVAEGARSRERALLIGTDEEFLHQVAAEAQLGLRHALQMGEFHCQHGRPVLECDLLRGTGL